MTPQKPIDHDEISSILDAINAGTPGAPARLMEVVLHELRTLAAGRLRAGGDCSLSPTALVNEAYLKLFGTQEAAKWNSRGHFYGSAANAMRQILINHAREKRRLKRGGDRLKIDLDVSQLPYVRDSTADQLLDLDQALQVLAQEDPGLVQLIELKFFAGQSSQSAAESLQISERTAYRRWQYAKARMSQILRENKGQ